MITLTAPIQVSAVLGGTTMVNYEKLVLTPITFDPASQQISGNVRLTSTSTPTMQPISGTFLLNVPQAKFTIEIPQIRFYRQITTTSGQNTAILNQIEAAQAQVENGLVTLGAVDGLRTAGA